MSNDFLRNKKVETIKIIVDSNIKSFAEGFETKYITEIKNSKRNMPKFGKEFYTSSFVRTFYSSFGKVLENIGNSIAKLSYEVMGKIIKYDYAKAEKTELLQEYFLLKNKISGTDEEISIFLGTAYNRFGEGSEWKQERVQQYFSEEELLIGYNYWNFVCNDDDGFNIVFNQYKKSCQYIKNSLEKIKQLYFETK